MEGQHKTYRPWDALENGHEPVSPRDALPENDLVFFLIDLIPQLDLDPFHSNYAGELRGQPPFDVTMMVTLLVYAYALGVCSSRKIAAACERNLAFRAIVGGDRPDFRTISDFRKIHRAALKPLFIEVLRLAGALGMVKLGNLSTDGTKMRASASRHKAMSYGYMAKEIARLEAEVERLLRDAERLDAEQDAALGSRRGDELPDEIRLHRQSRWYEEGPLGTMTKQLPDLHAGKDPVVPAGQDGVPDDADRFLGRVRQLPPGRVDLVHHVHHHRQARARPRLAHQRRDPVDARKDHPTAGAAQVREEPVFDRVVLRGIRRVVGQPHLEAQRIGQPLQVRPEQVLLAPRGVRRVAPSAVAQQQQRSRPRIPRAAEPPPPIQQAVAGEL